MITRVMQLPLATRKTFLKHPLICYVKIVSYYSEAISKSMGDRYHDRGTWKSFFVIFIREVPFSSRNNGKKMPYFIPSIT